MWEARIFVLIDLNRVISCDLQALQGKFSLLRHQAVGSYDLLSFLAIKKIDKPLGET
jgi:hypothetical protein